MLQIELSPIETSMELIQKKTQSLRAEVSTATPNIKSLQLALQGSLLLRMSIFFMLLLISEVNAGPMEICRVFLGDNMTKFSFNHVEKLVATMNQFLKYLGKGLEVNSRLINVDQIGLQKELLQSYLFLQAEFSKYMTIDLEDNFEDDQESTKDDDTIENSAE